MELGGNKNAQMFYDEHQMFKEGKPDHEAPQNSRQKMELLAKAEAAVREEMQGEGKVQKYYKSSNGMTLYLQR